MIASYWMNKLGEFVNQLHSGVNSIDHFRVTLNLIMKARLSAKFLL